MATATLAIPDSAWETLREQIRQVVLEEAHHVLKDVEWRHAQTLERERTLADKAPWMRRRVTAEDFNTSQHILTGYTITANSPSGGSVAWASLHIVYNGVDNAVTDGNTALKYAYWQSATPTAMQTSNTKPTLGKDDLLVFVNNAGTPIITALDSNQSLPNLVANAAIDSTALATGAVTSTAIASGAVTSTALASGSVGTTAIASGAVGTTQLASGAVTSTILASGAVTAVKLSTLQHVLY